MAPSSPQTPTSNPVYSPPAVYKPTPPTELTSDPVDEPGFPPARLHQFVDVIDGPYSGRYGSTNEYVEADDNFIVRTRDDDDEFIVVAAADLRPSVSGRR